jgi:large subunit ribosomal protein L23
MKDPRDIIRRPIITEETTEMMEQGKYVFEVDLNANKVEIKKAIEQLFDVKVKKLNTMRVKGKIKRYGRFSGRTPERKKAIVTLAPDSKPIEIFQT